MHPLGFEYTFDETLSDHAHDVYFSDFKQEMNFQFRKALPGLAFGTATGAVCAWVCLEFDLPSPVLYLSMGVAALFGIPLILTAVIHPLVYVLIFFARRRADAASRSMAGLSDAKIAWTLHEDHLETSSPSAHRMIPWSDIRVRRVCPEFWFLRVRNCPDLVAPTEHLSEPMRDMIRQKTGLVEEKGKAGM